MNIFLKKTLTFFLGCIMAFFILEIGLKTTNPIKFSIKKGKISLYLNKKKIIDNKKGYYRGCDDQIIYDTNSLGFRGEDISKKEIPHKLSIIAIGGSTTECMALSNGKDWPNYLSGLLKRNFKSVWVNNAGRAGHSTFAHKIMLKDNIVNLKPKIVLFLIGINDVGRKSPIDFDEIVAAPFSFKNLHRRLELYQLLLNVKHYFIAKERNLIKIGKDQSLDLKKLSIKDDETINLSEIIKIHNKSYLPDYKKRINEFIEICKNNEIEPIFITQPILVGTGIDPITGVNLEKIHINKGIRTSEELKRHGKDFFNIIGETGRDQWQILELYNNATKEICKENNVFIIDLGNTLEKSSEYFYDFCHYTNKGGKKVADIIYSELKPYLEKKYAKYHIPQP